MNSPFKENEMFVTPETLEELEAYMKADTPAPLMMMFTWNYLCRQFQMWLVEQQD